MSKLRYNIGYSYSIVVKENNTLIVKVYRAGQDIFTLGSIIYTRKRYGVGGEEGGMRGGRERGV